MASVTSPEQRIEKLREGLTARLARGSRETNEQIEQEVEKVFEAYLGRVKRSGACSEEDARAAFEKAIEDWTQGKAEGVERDVFLQRRAYEVLTGILKSRSAKQEVRETNEQVERPMSRSSRRSRRSLQPSSNGPCMWEHIPRPR